MNSQDSTAGKPHLYRIAALPLLLMVAALFTNASLHADVAEDDQRVPAIGVDPEVRDRVLAAIRAKLPDLPVLAVVKTPLADLISLELEGGQIIYASRDGDYILSGDLYQLQPTLVNLAEERRAKRRVNVLAKVPKDELIVFAPSGVTKTYINVFTDVDCGYCRKLHQEVPALNALGVEVRYLAYPRAGFDTPTYGKIVSAWCADDPQRAITALKSGSDIATKQCTNPVKKHYELGQLVGVTGTPAIVTASGKLLPGYMPADKLAATIGLE